MSPQGLVVVVLHRHKPNRRLTNVYMHSLSRCPVAKSNKRRILCAIMCSVWVVSAMLHTCARAQISAPHTSHCRALDIVLWRQLPRAPPPSRPPYLPRATEPAHTAVRRAGRRVAASLPRPPSRAGHHSVIIAFAEQPPASGCRRHALLGMHVEHIGVLEFSTIL
eukprot:COSAG02_NODE_7609_length_2935_cov_18.687212_3_plen_165_part_00